VLFVATGPIYEPQGDTGLMFQYHPFVPLQDTDYLRQLAIEVWKTVRPRAESLGVPFVGLQATTRTSAMSPAQPPSVNYGFVIERHADGLWYFLSDSLPIQK
jgi:hypothetical protein